MLAEMFSAKESTLARSYPKLFATFLRRFKVPHYTFEDSLHGNPNPNPEMISTLDLSSPISHLEPQPKPY